MVTGELLGDLKGADMGFVAGLRPFVFFFGLLCLNYQGK